MLPNDVAAAYPLFTVAHRDHIEAKPMPAVVSQSMEAATRPAGDLAKQIDGRPMQQASKALESEAWDVGGHGDPAVELPFSLYPVVGPRCLLDDEKAIYQCNRGHICKGRTCSAGQIAAVSHRKRLASQ